MERDFEEIKRLSKHVLIRWIACGVFILLIPVVMLNAKDSRSDISFLGFSLWEALSVYYVILQYQKLTVYHPRDDRPKNLPWLYIILIKTWIWFFIGFVMGPISIIKDGISELKLSITVLFHPEKL